MVSVTCLNFIPQTLLSPVLTCDNSGVVGAVLSAGVAVGHQDGLEQASVCEYARGNMNSMNRINLYGCHTHTWT